ncbi:geraniol 8-hydroxylase [Dendrobium catenatum]|uniref:Geraniol 8-hydroxylase-like protein n=2 Tax=Dendrobium TaxID=37818 RepID=A0A7T0FXP1_DENNO|nr:geraniol 8-hydroxylase [Dendrobium catenatum]PKU66140.1 Geraniol 8-hydroxylase [Dendrobium catenatum]QPJ58147.1 geraniol 8-hydroxylase-like protein [Dendrobium nobile]
MESIFHLNSGATPIFVAAVATIILFYILLFGFRPPRIPSITRPSLPPGPSGLPIVGNLPFLEAELHSFFTRLASTYGPIFRLRLGSKLAIIISSPTLAREILHDQDLAFANHDVPAAARAITYGGADILWTPHGPTWRMLRRICVRELLSPTSLAAVYHHRRRQIRSAIRRLYEHAAVGDPVNVGDQIFVAVLNVVTSMLWGGTVEVENGSTDDLQVGRQFRELVGEITLLLGKPNLSDFFPELERFDLQGIVRKMDVLREKLDEIYDNIIESKRKGSKVKAGEDFLDYMLKAEDEGLETNTTFTITHVKAMLMEIVVAGTDTTSNAVEFALAEMLNRVETMKRVQDELEHVVGKHNIVEEHHIDKLPYLNATIKEVLRLHPTVPLLVPHRPSSTCTVGGYMVPEGSRVFINAWAIHRDPAIWKEPLEFKPERFMNTIHERKWDGNGNDFNYLPFGSGRRICAGIAMAEKMLAYCLASLLHSFDWKLEEGKKLDLSEKFGIVLKKAEPLVVIPVARLSNPDLYY